MGHLYLSLSIITSRCLVKTLHFKMNTRSLYSGSVKKEEIF